MGRRADEVEELATHVGQLVIVNDVAGDGYRGVLFEMTERAVTLCRDLDNPVQLLTPGADGATAVEAMGGIVSIPLGRVKHIQEPD